MKSLDANLEILDNATEVDIDEDLPILYGYGTFLDAEAPCKTTLLSDIRRRLPRQGGASKLLWAVMNVAKPLNEDGNLDLSAAAGVIFSTKGSFLGCRNTRKIRGDVLIVGGDGIYLSSRFKGIAVEGSLEVNLALVKVGMKLGREADKARDQLIDNLSKVAEHILGREYKPQYFDHQPENMVRGPDDLWSDEVAVVNTLVALLCRKFGRFRGFSAVASTPSSVRVFQKMQMEADIFLPSLNVWEHPHSVILRDAPRRIKRWGFRVLTFTYADTENTIISRFWDCIVYLIATCKQWPPKFVRHIIIAVRQPPNYQARVMRIQARDVFCIPHIPCCV